ncbi:MAG TPA: CehA/McbA family metallohydrolase [Candidatus Hydrogenedentes bacterium]|nr:CehA/McbA family metallohydrolase [Candidatus Hydrogenedentota bacterium]
MMDQATFDHYYRLLATLIHECPTNLQVQAIEQAESIYQNTHGWRRSLMTDEDRAQASRDTLALYERLRKQYAVVAVGWSESSVTLGQCAPIPVARGIPRHILVEVRNHANAQTKIGVFTEETRIGPRAFSPVPSGSMRPFPARLFVTDCVSDRVRLLCATSAHPEDSQHVDVSVVALEPAALRGKLIEREDERMWPGRVYVQCSDNVFRHGKAFADNTTVSEKPVIFRPATYKLRFFYSDGRFEIDVPPGKTDLTLERGFEHDIVSKTLSLEPGQTAEVELRSSRFLDMKRLGWISSDTHVHWAKNSWDVNEDIALLAMVQRAEDLRVVNNLTLYQWRPEGAFIKPDQFPMGSVPGYCNGEYHIHMGEEYRNDRFYGHINLLDIKDIILPIATGPGSGGGAAAVDYPHNSTVIRQCHDQGGICCEAHGFGPKVNSDVPINVINGLSDAIDQLDHDLYYLLLNCGQRVPLGNGSDHPARVLGCARTYVKVDGYFTYSAWIDGIRKGRTFITSGPLLFLSVNGEQIGARLDARPGETLRIKAKARSRYPVGNLQIVSNGEVLRATKTSARAASLEVVMRADEPRWFVARCGPGEDYAPIHTAEEYYTARPHIAHSSAIYVDVAGRCVVKRQAVETIIERMKQHAVDVAQNGNFENGDQRREAVGYVEDGIKKYAGLLNQAP